jgi:hypothetical protein
MMNDYMPTFLPVLLPPVYDHSVYSPILPSNVSKSKIRCKEYRIQRVHCSLTQPNNTLPFKAHPLDMIQTTPRTNILC